MGCFFDLLGADAALTGSTSLPATLDFPGGAILEEMVKMEALRERGSESGGDRYVNWGFLRIDDTGPLVASADTMGLMLAMLAMKYLWPRRRAAGCKGPIILWQGRKGHSQ